jgi:putative DNA primase/helicase
MKSPTSNENQSPPRQCGGKVSCAMADDNNNDDAYGDEWERAFYENCDQAKREHDRDSGAYQAEIARLAALPKVDYEVERKAAAKRLGMRASVLDAMVEAERPKDQRDDFTLPHWNVQPWPSAVSGAELLNDLAAIFCKYIYIPPAIADAAALWGVHAWTIDAGDISPFFVLVSPTKRCGKTSMLILLMYLTPRSELASNISPSALFRYVEHVHPTLLIDEADSFVGASEEMRGILNSGHTRVAANVIRNVELNGEHLPRRFSVWAPKAIATIRDLADTLEDRSIVVQLQRKPKGAKVARLRKRDCHDFAMLRSKAARWAQDNFDALADDPDPGIPDDLHDRAADNWRPLIAIADLAGGDWPRRARDAACVLSGAGHEAKSINVECLADIKTAFAEAEALRSVDLVEILNADQERPWATWNKGKPISQKQVAGLLKPFGIISETVHIEGLKDAKGYRRVRFEEAWAAYLPGQNDVASPSGVIFPSKRPNADGTGTSGIFSSVLEGSQDGSKNDDLSHSHAGLDAWTGKSAGNGAAHGFDQKTEPPDATHPLVCQHCGAPETADNPVREYTVEGDRFLLHAGCESEWLKP